MKKVFSTDYNEKPLSSKIVVGFERISEAFKALLWQHAKVIGLSPIQIQILIFVANHTKDLCTVSQLAKEFNITKATVSDAVKTLVKKELITKETGLMDSRSYTIALSDSGKKVVEDTETFANPIKSLLDEMDEKQLESIYLPLTQMIHSLQKNSILTVQRTCYSCYSYQKNDGKHYCNYLKSILKNKDIRLDCAEYIPLE